MNLLKAGISAVIVMACMQATASAQTYTQAPVTVSKEKVRGSDGKVYYSHVVLEKQTLFSIAKAYGVSVDDICNANQELDLKTVGLKKNSIILIPTAGTQAKPAEQTAPEPEKQERSASESRRKDDSKKADNKKDDYTIHVTKWYEDIEDIAYKYSISKELLMSYNGLKTSKLKNRQKLRIPTAAKVRELEAERKSAAKADTPAADVKEIPSAESKVNQEPEENKVNALLIMPFKASTTSPSETSMDFYSGVLLAAKDRGDDGSGIDLNVYDVAGGTMPVTEERFAASDFVIGPVPNADLARTVNASRGKAWIVSPLDPKAEALADTIPNVIQAPTPTKAQIKDMAEWIRSDMKASDKVILISQKGAAASSYSASVAGEVRNHGLSPENISFNILEGRQMMGRIDGAMTGNGTNRVVIASDSKAFVIEVTRLLYLIASQKKNIVLYGTSKIRTFDEIDVDQLHSLNLHCSVSYYVDYDSKSVQNFLMEYRALFNTEPSRSAFQGYDLMTFFTNLNSEYGGRWDGENNLKGKGLQSDFHLIRTARGGFVNEAVRRIVYKSDYTVSLVR